MKNSMARIALLISITLCSTQVAATGFENLPISGFIISGGTTAYLLCNTSGDFGQSELVPPTPSANNRCAIFPTTGHKPLSAYTKVLDATRVVYIKNAYTGFDDIPILYLRDEVWRESNTNNYIFANRYGHYNEQYIIDEVWDGCWAGEPMCYFNVNDFKRAGFEYGNDTARTVDIAYYWQDAADEGIFRAGRTRTGLNSQPERPLTGAAPLDANWVTLTTDTSYLDDDMIVKRYSPWMYFKTTINTNPSTTPLSDDNIKELVGAVEFYQSGQEGQPLLTATSTAYAPWDADTD